MFRVEPFVGVSSKFTGQGRARVRVVFGTVSRRIAAGYPSPQVDEKKKLDSHLRLEISSAAAPLLNNTWSQNLPYRM